MLSKRGSAAKQQFRAKQSHVIWLGNAIEFEITLFLLFLSEIVKRNLFGIHFYF